MVNEPEPELTDTTALDLVWGAKAIATEINTQPRKAFHMLETGKIPAKKVGNRWVAERGQLREFFTGDAKGPCGLI